MVKKCEKCGKEIQDERNFDAHVARCVHNLVKTLSCDKCHKKYSYRSSLYLHKRTCTGPTNKQTMPRKKPRNTRRRVDTSPYKITDSYINSTMGLEPTDGKHDPRYRYTLCLRTKTCTYEPIPEDELNETTYADNEINFTEEQQIDENDSEIYDEYIIDADYMREHNIKFEEIEEDDVKTEDDDEGVVVIEDYGYFNKVEVRKRIVEDNTQYEDKYIAY